MGFGGSGGGSGSIQTSSDVALSGLSNNDVLTYNTSDSKWENKPAQGGSGAVSSVNSKTGAVTLSATDVGAVPLSSGGQTMRIVGYGTTLPGTGQAGDVFFLQGP